jgi:hypothetical protein
MTFNLTRFHDNIILRRGRSARGGLPSHEESRRDLEAARVQLYGAERLSRRFS